MRGTYRKIEDTLFCGKRILHLSMLTPLLFCSNWPGDWILKTSVENVWTFARTQITGGKVLRTERPRSYKERIFDLRSRVIQLGIHHARKKDGQTVYLKIDFVDTNIVNRCYPAGLGRP